MTTPKQKFAHEIVIDNAQAEIRIDGIVFPYFTMGQPEIMLVGDGVMGAVTVTIPANNVTLVKSDGESQTVVKANKQAELEWAGRRAKEIVLEGLEGIIRQLPDAEIEQRERIAMQEARDERQRRFVEASREKAALLSLIGNLDGTITADELRERAGKALGWSE